jgi:signal transduction histidine kinase
MEVARKRSKPAATAEIRTGRRPGIFNRMRRKAKIVFAITFMITVMVTVFSYLYVSQFLRNSIKSVSDSSESLARDIGFAADRAVPDLTSTRVDTDKPKKVQAAIEEYLRTDKNLNDQFENGAANYKDVVDVALVDLNNRIIVHSIKHENQVLADRPNFSLLAKARFIDQLRIIYGPPAVYDVVFPFRLNNQDFGTVRIGISPVLLKSETTPKLTHMAYFSALSIVASFLLAAFISNVALGPLREINRNLDDVSTGTDPSLFENSSDEVGLVTLKIAHLGRQVRDAQEIFSALKDNVDQLMANLQDGLMLFTRDTRVVLVSASVERFLQRPRRELLGQKAADIFSESSPLGSLVLDSFRRGRGVGQREILFAGGQRVQVSMDFIQEKTTHIGALLIMRDSESVRRIEDEIEMSRRLSASSRVTRGVGHEFKNPINAIVLHLHLLQNKLEHVDAGTRRHVDIIDSEIHRLDRLVQRLMDIYPRRDLLLEEMDMKTLLEDVAQLAQPDAEQRGVRIVLDLDDRTPLPVKVDNDFMKQAVLNVVINGIQAMPEGGTLTMRARDIQGLVTTEIIDTGSGIPAELQDKIFELYFTTKEDGSGIGLAQTYQVLQWHYGGVEFETAPGQGTTFRLRLPLAQAASTPSRAALTPAT